MPSAMSRSLTFSGLGGPGQDGEGVVGAAVLPFHDDAFGLFDDGSGFIASCMCRARSAVLYRAALATATAA